MKTKNDLFKNLGIAAAMAITVAACTNIGGIKSNRSRTNPTTLGLTSSTYTISSINVDDPEPVVSPSPGATSDPVSFTIFFDQARSATPLTTPCKSGDKSCYCYYRWTETGFSNGQAVSYDREDFSPIDQVLPYMVVCDGPQNYANEIDVGTIVNVTVKSAENNSTTFTSNTYQYRRTSGTGMGSLGDFQDAVGASFANIHRYSCYETRRTVRKIWNEVQQIEGQDDNSSTTNVLMASAFCSGTKSTAGCKLAPATLDFSTQSYWYNMYIRNTDRGQINASTIIDEAGTGMVCPKVKEVLWAQSPDFYPLDTSFALSVTRTAQFRVGVEAFSKLKIENDFGSQDTSCNESADAGAGAGAAGGGENKGDKLLTKSCIGFAAKPSPAGACPTIRLANGTLKPTYRLRRFITLYPLRYHTDGTVRDDSQPRDYVYVLDRPVSAPGMDPTRPYTMRGPKPCPFAFYDEMGVLGDPMDPNYAGGMPGYAATNFPGWNGTNVDGMEFPFMDRKSMVPSQDRNANSCSAAIPLLNDSKSVWSLTTINRKNPVYKRLFVRPQQAWAPHYEEDTAFEACAPAPDVPKDPPIHFAKDPATGNVSYCAEAYPTQNPFVSKVDTPQAPSMNIPGYVSPYTSHVVKNSASASCTNSSLDLSSIVSKYPPNPSLGSSTFCAPGTQATVGPAWHPNNYLVDSNTPRAGNVCSNGGNYDALSNTCYYCAHQTCDRTVSAPSSAAWPFFPLLARPERVEQAIMSDTTYNCTVTYDNGLGKMGKVTPNQGCCGTAVQVWTGFDSSAAPNINRANTTAHLEPDQQCLIPQY
ncbi:MAG: hypothetical protein JNL01_13800 [Bdellovibrionales bacterium]|nr:hypothetical protein [Bdellovibrionales bacterium]